MTRCPKSGSVGKRVERVPDPVPSMNSAVTKNGVPGIVNCTILDDLIPGSGRASIRLPAKVAASVRIRPQARCVVRNDAPFRCPSRLLRPLLNKGDQPAQH